MAIAFGIAGIKLSFDKADPMTVAALISGGAVAIWSRNKDTDSQ